MGDPSSRSAGPGAAAAARIIYIGIISSTAIISIGAYVMRRSVGLAEGLAGPLDVVALCIGVGSVLFVVALRSRIPARSAASDEVWWRANVGRAVLVWALLEAPALLGAVTLFVSGRLLAYTVLVAFALFGLASATPSRLSGG